MIDFLTKYIRLIAQFPEKVRVEQSVVDSNFYEITVYADRADTSRIIGKDGKMINSIKTVMLSCKVSNAFSYRITVKKC